MSNISVDYSERLKSLREELIKFKSQKYNSDFLDDISHELSDLEQRVIASPQNFSESVDSVSIEERKKKIQEQLDSTVKLYEESYDRTRKILFEKQSLLDGPRLLSEEELTAIRREYSEKLLQENSYSIFLRKMIELERQLLEKYQNINEEEAFIDKDVDKVTKSGSTSDIDLIYFSEAMALGDKARSMHIENEILENIRESALLMPEKVVTPKAVVDYIPKSAPEDMVDLNKNEFDPTDICCFRTFRDELKQGGSFNVVHATSGRYMDIDRLLYVIKKPQEVTKKSSSDVDRMLEPILEEETLYQDVIERRVK